MQSVNFDHLPQISLNVRFHFWESIPNLNRKLIVEAFKERVAIGITNYGITIPPITLVTEFTGYSDGTIPIIPCKKHNSLYGSEQCFRCIFHYVDLSSDFRTPYLGDKEHVLSDLFLELMWIRRLETSKQLRNCIDERAFPTTQ